jgi:uncharacterized protein YcbK (DUF882 family)
MPQRLKSHAAEIVSDPVEARSHVKVCTAHKALQRFSPSCVARGAALAAFILVASQSANAAGDTRTLSLHNIHTNEDLTITYKKDGRFDPEALKRLNAFLRDWRKDAEITMDPQLFDLLWEVHRDVKATGPVHIVCGYRSPATNAMLRSRSKGVARTSLHMQGKAIDFTIPSAEVADVRAAALRLQGGGVGFYPSSGFVHMDVGNIRHWPRMTRDQLARVFPNGRTVHVPTDGNPLPGYELALADIDRGVNRRSAEPKRGLIASLFGASQDAEETGDTATVKLRPAPAAPTRVAAASPETTPVPAETTRAVPLPPSKPQIFQVASAESRPVPAPAPRTVSTNFVNMEALSPNDIINARGYWQGLPEAPEGPAAIAAAVNNTPAAAPVANVSAARRTTASQTASADVELTATIAPFARADRVPPEVALAYAAQADVSITPPVRTPPAQPLAAAVVTTQGTASVALKPVDLVPPTRPVRADERLDDPWIRGVVMAPSVQTSMVTTTFGVPDFRNLRSFMEKPASTVMMTFSSDPHLGMSYEHFTGSAIVFNPTVTFGMRTAGLNR